jgi:hypothetical protein
MKFKLPVAVSRTVGKTVFSAKKNSPTILFVAGVGGILTSGVLACKATLKVEDVLNEHQKTAMDIKTVQHVNYSEKDRQGDMTLLYIQSAVKLTKLYGPSIVLATLSIGMLTKSHNILTKRNAGLTMAYATLEKGFKDYRSRVVAEYGEDKDREFRFGKHKEKVLVESKNGPKKKEVDKPGDNLNTGKYQFLFDETNQNWDPNHDYNVVFLRGVQAQSNRRLNADGYLFLNDVLEDLGMDKTSAGAVTGWLRDGGPDNAGDGYVDFGIFNSEQMDQVHDFCLGLEGAVWLDFNVDGPIFREIDSISKWG